MGVCRYGCPNFVKADLIYVAIEIQWRPRSPRVGRIILIIYQTIVRAKATVPRSYIVSDPRFNLEMTQTSSNTCLNNH